MHKLQLLALHACGLIGAFLAPVHGVMIAVSVLVLLDFITGVLSSMKSKKKITSKGFQQTIYKTLAYQAVIVTALVLEKYLIPELPVIKVVSSLIAVTETKSLLENVEVLTGIDFWGAMVSKLPVLNKKDK